MEAYGQRTKVGPRPASLFAATPELSGDRLDLGLNPRLRVTHRCVLARTLAHLGRRSHGEGEARRSDRLDDAEGGGRTACQARRTVQRAPLETESTEHARE